MAGLFHLTLLHTVSVLHSLHNVVKLFKIHLEWTLIHFHTK